MKTDDNAYKRDFVSPIGSLCMYMLACLTRVNVTQTRNQ